MLRLSYFSHMLFSRLSTRIQEKAQGFLPWIVVAGFILAGLIVRLLLINIFYINSDEAWHIDIASKSSLHDVIATNFSENVHPPLYYLLLHAVMGISDNITTLRLLSVLPWMVWVLVCYRIGEEIKGSALGLICAALAAFSNGALDLSLSIREYMWMELFLTMQFLFFIRLYKQPSYRDMVLYWLCGVIAISFEYSAVISIFAMGCMLAWQQLQLKCKPFKRALAIAMAHLSLAAFFLVMYSQHEFHRIENIKWYDLYYYGPTIIVLTVSLEHVVRFIIEPYAAMVQVFIVALFATVQPFWRRFPILAAFLILNWFLMLVLNFAHLYPPAISNRFMTWMLPCNMVWMAFGLLFIYEWSALKVRRYAAAFALAGFIWSTFANFNLYTDTIPEYQTFLEVADAIPPSDIILMDIQSVMALKYQSDWQVAAHYEHLDEALWKGRRVFYPNWRKMDSVDTRTYKLVGGIDLERQTLFFLADLLHQRDADNSHVWLVQKGRKPNLSIQCMGSLWRFGAVKINQKYGFILRFTTQKFYDFLENCNDK